MTEARVSRDYEDLVFLCRETINERASALVFCSSRQACEKVAHQRASALFFVPCVLNLSSRRLTIITPAWIRIGGGASSATLRAARLKFYVVPRPSPSASIYLRGASSSMVLNRFDDKAAKLHQMIGRAGRYGLDTSGSAVIFCSNDTEFDAALAMYRGAARSFGHTDRDSISLTAPLFLVRTGPAAYAAAAIAAKKGARFHRGVRGILTNSIEGFRAKTTDFRHLFDFTRQTVSISG